MAGLLPVRVEALKQSRAMPGPQSGVIPLRRHHKKPSLPTPFILHPQNFSSPRLTPYSREEHEGGGARKRRGTRKGIGNEFSRPKLGKSQNHTTPPDITQYSQLTSKQVSNTRIRQEPQLKTPIAGAMNDLSRPQAILATQFENQDVKGFPWTVGQLGRLNCESF